MSRVLVLARQSARWTLALFFAVALAACTVQFVSNYDEVFDRSAADTQKTVTLLLNELQRHGSPARQYSNSVQTYADVNADLHALRVRADANNSDQKNADTLAILAAITESFALVEGEHRRQPRGPSVDFVASAQRSIDLQFVSLIQLEAAKKR